MRAGPGTNFGDESDESGTSFADVTLQLLPPGRVERTLRRLTEDGLPAGPAPSREMTTSWTVLPSGGSLSREMTANWTVLPSGGSLSREMTANCTVLPSGGSFSREMTTSWTVLPSGGSLSREMTANWTVLPSGGSAPSREMLVRDGQPFSVRFRGNIRCDDGRSVSRPPENFNLVT